MERRLEQQSSQAAIVALRDLLGAAAVRLNEVIERGKYDRVFFLSREGLLLFKAYRAVFGRKSQGFLRYILASRRGLSLASSRTLRDCYRLLDTPFHPQPLSQLLESRFGVICEDRSPETRIVVSRHEKTIIRRHIRARKGEILERAAMERQHYVHYLRSKGWHAGGRYLLVDIGYNGTYHRAYERLMPDSQIDSFCIAAFLGAQRLVQEGRMHLLFEGVRDNRLRVDPFSRNVAFIEALMMAPHPSFISVGPGKHAGLSFKFDGVAKQLPQLIDRLQRKAIDALVAQPLHNDPEAVSKGVTSFERWITSPSIEQVCDFQGLVLDDRFGGKLERPIVADSLISSTRQISFEDAVACYTASEWKDGALVLLKNKQIASPMEKVPTPVSFRAKLRKKFHKLFRSREAFVTHTKIFVLKRFGLHRAPKPVSAFVADLLAAQVRPPH